MLIYVLNAAGISIEMKFGEYIDWIFLHPPTNCCLHTRCILLVCYNVRVFSFDDSALNSGAD